MMIGQGRLYKKIVVVLLSSIFLIGCQEQETMKVPSPIRSVQTLQFVVNTNLDKEFQEEAELFASNVAKISENRLNISIIKSQSEALPDAEYDFAYLRNKQAAQIDPSLETLSLPFLYNDASHLSLALNSPDVKKLIENRLGIKAFPLAALSSGNALLLTTKSMSKSEMEMPIYFQNLILNLHEDAVLKTMAFEALGTKVKKSKTEINGVEVSMEQALMSQFTAENLYAIETCHDLEPIWLTIKTDTWQGLSKWEKAVIQEATAGLIAGFENNKNLYNAAWEREAVKQGITIVQPERQILTAMIYNYDSNHSRFQIPNYFDKQLFDLVQGYR